jgi:hypothetical protein
MPTVPSRSRLACALGAATVRERLPVLEPVVSCWACRASGTAGCGASAPACVGTECGARLKSACSVSGAADCGVSNHPAAGAVAGVMTLRSGCGSVCDLVAAGGFSATWLRAVTVLGRLRDWFHIPAGGPPVGAVSLGESVSARSSRRLGKLAAGCSAASEGGRNFHWGGKAASRGAGSARAFTAPVNAGGRPNRARTFSRL